MSQTLWVVGKVDVKVTTPENEGEWDFMGVFTTPEKAEAICTDETYFVGPCELDVPTGEPRVSWPGAYWPAVLQGGNLNTRSEEG